MSNAPGALVIDAATRARQHAAEAPVLQVAQFVGAEPGRAVQEGLADRVFGA